MTKTLKFNLETSPREEKILERLTARLTFGVQNYLEVIREEQTTDKTLLTDMTLTCKTRPKVAHDLKQKTKLGAVFLQQCRDAAIWMVESYEALRKKWERRRERATITTIVNILSEFSFNTNGTVRSDPLEGAVDRFSETRLWRRLKKNKPAYPLESNKHKPRKLPTQFDQRNLVFYEDRGEFFVRIATLRNRERLTLKLSSGEYQKEELADGEITGGKLIKNLKRKCWEFHATIRKELPKLQVTHPRSKAVVGVDLGISTDATVVVLIEGEKLKREQFFFLKESDLRHEKAILNVNIKRLQNLVAKTRGNNRKEYSRELRNNRHKRKQLTREACYRISRKVALIAKGYLEEGFEVSIAIGKLKGLRNSTRKGDWKGRKFRGMINRFPYYLLTQFITYKAQELGITRVAEIKESWTSRVCHKCGSTKTERPTQAQFVCLACGLSYNADANGAINIALRFVQKISGSQRLLLKGFCEQPYRDESTLKVEETGSFLKF